MKKYVLLSFLFVAAMACTTKNSKETETNISQSEHLVNASLWFQQSAEMQAVFYQAYDLAKLKLEQKQGSYKGDKPMAVVLDIDETVLDNSPYEKFLIDEGKSYGSATWKEWCLMAKARALPGALEFTQWANENGIEVFYISNRKNDVLQQTIQNLDSLQFPNADTKHVLLRNVDAGGDKTERRQLVEQTHYVALYIGDNLTDYSELYADRDSLLGIDVLEKHLDELLDNFIALPNPMYGEWEGAIYGNDFSLSTEEKRALRKEAMEGM